MSSGIRHRFARAFNQASRSRQPSLRPRGRSAQPERFSSARTVAKLVLRQAYHCRLTHASAPRWGQRACGLCRGARRQGVRRSARATRRACWTGRSSARRQHPRLQQMWQGRAQSWCSVAQAVTALALLGAIPTCWHCGMRPTGVAHSQVLELVEPALQVVLGRLSAPAEWSQHNIVRDMPSPGADVAGASPVPVQMWPDEPSPGADVGSGARRMDGTCDGALCATGAGRRAGGRKEGPPDWTCSLVAEPSGWFRSVARCRLCSSRTCWISSSTCEYSHGILL